MPIKIDMVWLHWIWKHKNVPLKRAVNGLKNCQKIMALNTNVGGNLYGRENG